MTTTPSPSHRTAAMLRVKVKSLGAEIRMIRVEEERLKHAGRRRQAKAARGQVAAALAYTRDGEYRTISIDSKPADGASDIVEKVRADRDALPIDPVTNHYDTNTFWSFRRHRINLSDEARIAHLAACALRGTAYEDCEAENTRHRPDFAAIIETALRFSVGMPTPMLVGQRHPDPALIERLRAWTQAAQVACGTRRQLSFERALALLELSKAAAVRQAVPAPA